MNKLSATAKDNSNELTELAGTLFDVMRSAKAVITEKKVDAFAAGLAGTAIPTSKNDAWDKYLTAEAKLSGVMIAAAKAGNKSLVIAIYDNLQEVQTTTKEDTVAAPDTAGVAPVSSAE